MLIAFLLDMHGEMKWENSGSQQWRKALFWRADAGLSLTASRLHMRDDSWTANTSSAVQGQCRSTLDQPHAQEGASWLRISGLICWG
jgi:hypothetical protein